MECAQSIFRMILPLCKLFWQKKFFRRLVPNFYPPLRILAKFAYFLFDFRQICEGILRKIFHPCTSMILPDKLAISVVSVKPELFANGMFIVPILDVIVLTKQIFLN